MLRGWIVYDGDNVHRVSATSSSPNLSLTEIDQALRRHTWPHHVAEVINRDDIVFTRSVAFLTNRTQLDPVPGDHWEEADAESGILKQIYTLTEKRGYDDTVIFDYIEQNQDKFDFLIMVTSDRDFFPVMKWRSKVLGKQVMFVSFRHILPRRPNKSKLAPAHMFWMHDFLPELEPSKPITA